MISIKGLRSLNTISGHFLEYFSPLWKYSSNCIPPIRSWGKGLLWVQVFHSLWSRYWLIWDWYGAVPPNRNNLFICINLMGLVWDWFKLPYHSLSFPTWQSSNTIPIAHIIPMYGNSMDVYEIRIFSIDVGLVWDWLKLPYHSHIIHSHMAIIPYHSHSPYHSHIWKWYGFLWNTYLSHRLDNREPVYTIIWV